MFRGRRVERGRLRVVHGVHHRVLFVEATVLGTCLVLILDIGDQFANCHEIEVTEHALNRVKRDAQKDGSVEYSFYIVVDHDNNRCGLAADVMQKGSLP
jgi:hypothetical protein